MVIFEYLKRNKAQLLLILLLTGGLYASIVAGMVQDWYHDSNYSHGFLIPLIAGYFLYRSREQLKTVEVAPCNFGLPVILFALALLVAASLATEYFTLRLSLVVLICGLVLYLFGTEAFRVTRLPILYLAFMVPLPYIVYNLFAFPLKLFVTRLSVVALRLIGITVLREGNVIMFPAVTLEVADACSGIRSVLSLLALSVAYAFFLPASPARRWLIVLAALPLAIFTNALRVILTGILVQHWGSAAAEGLFHEFTGIASFALALALLLALGAPCREAHS
jgi:exosortase